jgi:hypothetical protein
MREKLDYFLVRHVAATDTLLLSGMLASGGRGGIIM